MVLAPESVPVSHWWEASALTTAPSLPTPSPAPAQDVRVTYERMLFIKMSIVTVVNRVFSLTWPASMQNLLEQKKVFA